MCVYGVYGAGVSVVPCDLNCDGMKEGCHKERSTACENEKQLFLSS